MGIYNYLLNYNNLLHMYIIFDELYFNIYIPVYRNLKINEHYFQNFQNISNIYIYIYYFIYEITVILSKGAKSQNTE